MKQYFLIFISTIAGACLTNYLIRCGLGPVISSSSVSFIFAVLLLKNSHKQALQGVFCGSFAGMTNPEMLTNIIHSNWLIAVILFAIVIAIIFTVFIYLENKKYMDIFYGVGGRIGTIAFISGILSLAIFWAIHVVYISKPDFTILVDPTNGAYLFANIIVTYLGVISYFILEKLWSDKSAVLVSSTITITYCCLLHMIDLEVYTFAFYTGVFVGMTTAGMFCKYRKIIASVIAGGLLFIMETSAPKIGGMLGFVAFMSVLLIFFTEFVYSKLLRRTDKDS